MMNKQITKENAASPAIKEENSAADAIGKKEKRPFKPIGRTSELMWVLGVFLVALGVCLCKKADLGVSMIAAPAFVVYEAVAPLWSGFSVGMVEYIIQGLMLAAMCLIVRRFNWRYLLAFASAVIYGYVLDMWLLIFGSDPFSALWLRWVMLIVGDVITAAGVACFFRTYMPLQVYELFVAEVADKFKKSVPTVKQIFDISCLLLSVTLVLALFRDFSFDWSTIYGTSYHSIGLGTILTTVINAPIIRCIGKLLDKLFCYTPLFPRMEKLLKT